MQVRGRSVGMGRVWVCMLICCSQIQYRKMVAQKQALGLWGLGCAKKPKDLSASEREERGHGEGVSTEIVNESALCTTYDVVCSRKAARHL